MRYFDREAMKRPEVLESERFRSARQELADYYAQDMRRQQQRRAPMDSGLTNHPEIKDALARGFGQVCAYCESDMSSFDFFDVEHHRPKAGAADQKGKTEHLYYAWLAYEWDNLYPICRICNSAKKNKFYVLGPRGPIGASVLALREQEQALLLDPCHDDIAAHLTFDLTGHARARTKQGDATIEMLALNREHLIQQRRQQLETVLHMSFEDSQLFHVSTGRFEGWTSAVLARRDGAPLAHAGATTLALLDWAAANAMPQLQDIADFLARWAKWSQSERDRLRAALAQSAPAAPEPPSLAADTPATVVSLRARTLRLREIEAAEQPLSSVQIRNFKALASINLALPTSIENSELVPCMLVLGENATGKSSVLEAIALALVGTRETAELDRLIAADAIRPDEFLHRPDTADWNVVAKAPLSVAVHFLGIDPPATIIGEAGKRVFAGTEYPSKIVLGYGPRRYFPRHVNRRFRAPAHRIRSLFDPMATIANPIGWLRDLRHRDQAKFDAAARALRIVLMLRNDALIDTDGDRLMIETAQGRTPLEKLSVGYKSVIAMAIDIIRELFTYYDNLENAYATVLVDEIETHLHPRWKLRIVGLLRQAFPRVQFILTTHDPLCLRGMYQGEVFVLRRSDNDNAVETLTELPSVQGMRAEQILTSEFFGLGSTDPATDAKVERYQYLTTRPELSADEKDERLQLAVEIEDRMMVGNTIEQQTQAEAARLANLDAPIALTKVQDGDRRRMIQEALFKLQGQGAALS